MKSETRNTIGTISQFHLAFPLRNLDEVRTCYNKVTGCKPGRVTWRAFAMTVMQLSRALLVLALLGSCATPHPEPRAGIAADTGPRATEADLDAIRVYIKKGWTELRRTHRQLLAAATDPKLTPTNGLWPVYVPEREDLAAIRNELAAEGVPAGELAQIELRRLPRDRSKIQEHGVLWLPKPYVVPGGRFNEMYGWDSYFILVGLLRDGEIELAKGIVDDFRYEIENYGMVLNANRTYFLSRSQPPFLTEMILAVYEKTADREWLRAALPAIATYYNYWNTAPHRTETGLSRYYDARTDPAPEVLADKRDERGLTYYGNVKEYYRTHTTTDYDVSRFYDAKKDELTDLFYVGDRSMRESGFDPSNRFGPFNVGIIDMNPVCLNSLLYQMEKDAAAIATILGDGPGAANWEARAADRKARIQALLWDEDTGLYLDYDYTKSKRRNYPFLTTFWPLWAGIADARQARKVVANLGLFERPGGLQTSTFRSGTQWDAPYGWAPLDLMAVKGLRRYGYVAEADRITVNSQSLVLDVFLEQRVIVEKYDAALRKSATGLKFGYTSNEIGFGWTNAVFIELLAGLPTSRRVDVLRRGGVGIGP
ncbi:MAG TPA: trehalase family glycosidase [Polyangiaceae bacterium]|nr:trehalase family glycosidase [Polyangiaceae bacterium]